MTAPTRLGDGSCHGTAQRYSIPVLRDGRWRTIHLFDHTHAVDEHHEHRYVGSCKQPPVTRVCDANTAMAAALEKLFTTWPEILDAWESPR